MDPKLQLTPHFNLSEFIHNGSLEGVTVDILENLRALANALEGVRHKLGDVPIHINSGFRTVQHNKEVGGAPNSQHLYGKAADIVADGLAPWEVQKILADWDGGLGYYSTWTHIDTGPRRRWTGP